MRQRRTVIRRRIIPGPGVATRAATCKSPGKKKTFLTEDGYEYNDWDESWQQYPAEEHDDWEEEADLETFLAGESDWVHRDVLDSDVLDSYVEEECSADKNLYEAYLVYKEARDTLKSEARTWFLARECNPCLYETLMSHSVAREKTARAPPTRARAKEARVEKSGKNKGDKGKICGKSSVKGKGDPSK